VKIAFVSIQDPTDPQTWSGIPSAILKHLVRSGADVEIIAPLSRKGRYLFLPLWVASKMANRGYHVDREPLLIASYAREIEKRMRGRRFDAIFSPETIAISRLNRPEPISYWSDAVWEIMTGYYYYNTTKGFHAKARLHEQQAMDKTSHAIYASDWAAAGASKHYVIDGNKLAVIPFGANLEIEHDRITIESALSARRSSSCVLLFVGVDWQRKGGSIAVETARLLNLRGLKTQLIVVGCNIPGEKPEFVTELGFVSKRTREGQSLLAGLLRTSHFLILPTKAECAGIVFSEASAFGLPIITTDTGGISTYVRQGINGVRLPVSASAEMFAGQIYRVLQDRSAYEAMALAGWEEYTQRLNWKSSVTSLLALLKQR
jgi:glycosyltransferase involved in cell wall biosynthesis